MSATANLYSGERESWSDRYLNFWKADSAPTTFTGLSPICLKTPSKPPSTTPPLSLLDENIDIRASLFLKERGHTVFLCPKSLKNGAVLELAQNQNCVLITNDTDFANPDLHDFAQTAGIVVLRLHPPKLESTLSALEKLLNAVLSRQFSKTLFTVTKEGIEITRKS